jgi:hypothetical protein
VGKIDLNPKKNCKSLLGRRRAVKAFVAPAEKPSLRNLF